MGYALGLDLGTTFTSAAICRNGRAEMVSLGNRASVIPSLVFLREDEQILVGDAAERRGTAEPRRLAREFKRRLGDSAPIMLGTSPYSAERIMAALMRDVVDGVTAREGGPPDAVAITYPANWGPYKTDLLRQAANLAGLRGATLLTEPIAAALHYASTERVDPGHVIAVYDLGGGTFDAAVLRKTAVGFEQLGDPEGIERLGGIDFDEAVFRQVRDSLGAAFDALDQDDPTVRSATQRLRQDSVEAKEALSSDTDATVSVLLPGLQTEIRITRPEFEAMIRPTLRETVEALRRAIASAGVTPTDLHAVLLVGGSSRIPLVSEMVSNELGRPVAVDAHPKHAVALGAALVAAGVADPGSATGGGARAATPVAPAPSATAPYPERVIVTREDLAAARAQAQPPAPTPAPAPVPERPPTHPAPVVPAPAATAAPAVPPPAVPGGWPDAPTAVYPGVVAPSPTPAVTPTPMPPAFAPPIASPSAMGGPPIAPTQSSGGGRPGRAERQRSPVLALAIGAIVVLALAGGGYVLLSGRDADRAGTTAESDTPIPTTAGDGGAEVASPPCESVSGRCAFITDLRLEENRYVGDYTVVGFEPVIFEPGTKGVESDHHVHFYFDTVGESGGGTNGSPPGIWEVWDRDSGGGELVFDAFTLANQSVRGGDGATQICASVADSVHGIESGSGNCVALPAGA